MLKPCTVATSGGLEDVLLLMSATTQCSLKWRVMPELLMEMLRQIPVPHSVAYGLVGSLQGTRHGLLSVAAARCREALGTWNGQEPLTLAYVFTHMLW